MIRNFHATHCSTRCTVKEHHPSPHVHIAATRLRTYFAVLGALASILSFLVAGIEPLRTLIWITLPGFLILTGAAEIVARTFRDPVQIEHHHHG